MLPIIPIVSRWWRRPPLLELEQRDWLLALFGWGLQQFDAAIFKQTTQLVLPDNHHFPGSVEGPWSLAQLLLRQVQHYAAVTHWPLQLLPPDALTAASPEALAHISARHPPTATAPPQQPITARAAAVTAAAADSATLPVTFDPELVRDPEALIGHFAHTIAFYLTTLATEPPPGGRENLPQATELVALLLGFGIPLANSAFRVRTGGCGGGCNAQAVQRHGYLSQYHLVYGVALFGQLKGMQRRQIQPHLKASLRPAFRQAWRELKAEPQQLAPLQQLLT